MTEAEIFPAGDVADDLTYRTILYPRGLGHAAATAVTLPTGDSFTIVLEREFVRGPVERDALDRLDAIRPDIARAATMSARLQLERARATTQVLEALGLAALVFDESGKVIAANPLIEAMTGEVRWLARDRLSLSDRSADLLLRAAIASIGAADGATARSFPVRDADGCATMVAHVVPIRLSARDIFVRCAGVLALTPLSPPNVPSVAIVQSLFDLTPAEARVARDLAEGKTVADIASGGGASENTFRNPRARRSGKDRLQPTDRRGRVARRSLGDATETDLTVPEFTPASSELWRRPRVGRVMVRAGPIGASFPS